MAKNSPASRIQLRADEDLWVAPGRRGWIYWDHPDADVRVRLAKSASKGWHVSTIWIDSSGTGSGVPTSVLRSLTFGPIEAIASAPELENIFDTDDPGLPELDPARCPPGEARERCLALPLRTQSVDLRIPIPPAGDRGAMWYQTFKLLYALASRQTRSPAKAIAEANNLPVTKVHGLWRETKRFDQEQEERWLQRERSEAARRARIETGLQRLGITWDEYHDRFSDQSGDPMGIWDEDGDEVGPPENLDLDSLQPLGDPDR